MASILEKTDAFVAELFKNELPVNCLYHNYDHTKRVFKSTKEILDHSDLSDEEKEIILITALLHDTGYCKDIKNHEEQSVTISNSYLSEIGYPETQISKVANLILATKMEHQPTNLSEQIIRDADASHFSKESYREVSELLRQELKLNEVISFSKKEWLATNINLFTDTHRYYTDYAIKHWEPKKQENLNQMLKEQAALKNGKKKEKYAKAAKEENPEKGVQTAFRVALRNHLKLSDIADTKANILLSVNAIILSLALSNLIPKLDNPSNQYLIIPALIFIFFSIVSMVLSVLATRPNVTEGEFTRKEIEEKKVNLLFFGNFHKMPLDEYEWAMNELIQDKDYIYNTMIKDLYFLGKVLHKKYKILRTTYTVFIIGIIVSVISFIVAFNSLPELPTT